METLVSDDCKLVVYIPSGMAMLCNCGAVFPSTCKRCPACTEGCFVSLEKLLAREIMEAKE